MKIIKSFKVFKEEAEFDVNLTDKPDVKASKEGLEILSKHLKEFKTKKVEIDNLFKQKIDNAELNKRVESIIGKEVDKRNPFLVSYLQVAQDQKRLDDLINKNISENSSIQLNQSLLSNSSDDVQKKSIQDLINKSQQNIRDNSTSISILKKSIDENSKKIKEDMSKIEEDLKDKIKTLQYTRN